MRERLGREPQEKVGPSHQIVLLERKRFIRECLCCYFSHRHDKPPDKRNLSGEGLIRAHGFRKYIIIEKVQQLGLGQWKLGTVTLGQETKI